MALGVSGRVVGKTVQVPAHFAATAVRGPSVGHPRPRVLSPQLCTMSVVSNDKPPGGLTIALKPAQLVGLVAVIVAVRQLLRRRRA